MVDSLGVIQNVLFAKTISQLLLNLYIILSLFWKGPFLLSWMPEVMQKGRSVFIIYLQVSL